MPAAQLADLPGTSDRVERNTAPEINARLQQQMRERVALFYGTERPAIDARIEELQQEWDIERTLETNAAAVILTGLVLGAFVDRKWLLLSGAASGFLLQHALQGWCPPLPLFRRLGVRTAREITEEIIAMRDLRGDFGEPAELPAAVDRAPLH